METEQYEKVGRLARKIVVGFPYGDYVLNLLVRGVPLDDIPTFEEIMFVWSKLLSEGTPDVIRNFQELIRTFNGSAKALLSEVLSELIEEGKRREEIFQQYLRKRKIDSLVLENASNLAAAFNLGVEGALLAYDLGEPVVSFADIIHPNPKDKRRGISFVGANMMESFLNEHGMRVQGLEGYVRGIGHIRYIISGGEKEGEIIKISEFLSKHPSVVLKLTKNLIPEVRKKTWGYFYGG